MNYITHLTTFFQRASSDARLNPTHISLYMAIFQFWNVNRFQNPVYISRQELMKISKISAKATYHKCIKDLHNFRYFDYQPSYNPFTGSSIYMFEFQSASSSKSEHYRAKIETSIEQVIPYKNIKNIINNKTGTSEGKTTSSENEVVIKVKNDKAKVTEINGQKIPPASFPKIKEFFLSENSTEHEAKKFYNHFQSIGWLVGGRSPMTDWQAAARNWILNESEFKKTRKQTASKPNTLNTTTNKNYSEPL